MLAYLVIREGTKWTDVFRLVPGQSVTIGRAPTNQIILKDDRCSRTHAEVFTSQGNWVLRDFDSRNGTVINGDVLRGDRVLEPGDIVRIGQSQLGFVHDLAKAFPESGQVPRLAPVAASTRSSDQTDNGSGTFFDESVLSDADPTTITHRRGQTTVPGPGGYRKLPPFPRRAGLRRNSAGWHSNWPKHPTCSAIAQLALNGLFEGTPDRYGRRSACAARVSRSANRRRSGDRRVAQRFAAALPPRFQLFGRHRPARRRSGAGPQRDGRQHAGHERQQGRVPRHQRRSVRRFVAARGSSG